MPVDGRLLSLSELSPDAGGQGERRMQQGNLTENHSFLTLRIFVSKSIFRSEPPIWELSGAVCPCPHWIVR